MGGARSGGSGSACGSNDAPPSNATYGGAMTGDDGVPASGIGVGRGAGVARGAGPSGGAGSGWTVLCDGLRETFAGLGCFFSVAEGADELMDASDLRALRGSVFSMVRASGGR